MGKRGRVSISVEGEKQKVGILMEKCAKKKKTVVKSSDFPRAGRDGRKSKEEM